MLHAYSVEIQYYSRNVNWQNCPGCLLFQKHTLRSKNLQSKYNSYQFCTKFHPTKKNMSKTPWFFVHLQNFGANIWPAFIYKTITRHSIHAKKVFSMVMLSTPDDEWKPPKNRCFFPRPQILCVRALRVVNRRAIFVGNVQRWGFSTRTNLLI